MHSSESTKIPPNAPPITVKPVPKSSMTHKHIYIHNTQHTHTYTHITHTRGHKEILVTCRMARNESLE